MAKYTIPEIRGKRQFRIAARFRDCGTGFLSKDQRFATWDLVENAKVYEDYGDARMEARVRVELERSNIFDTMVLDENGDVISAHMFGKDIEAPTGPSGKSLNFGDI